MTTTEPLPALTWKLWIYTNYDCNLSCSYCVAESTPRAPRNAIGLDNACRIVDEAVDLGFSELFFSGGEPFILDEIYDMLAYSSARLKTTVLTNAMLFNGRRLARLCEIANPNLQGQVSLDGGRAKHHEAYRGPGSLVPEITATKNGIYWHPPASPNSDDMLVTRQIFPLAAAVNCIQKNRAPQPDGVLDLMAFT